MYEYSTVKACSAILLRNSQGKVLHARNFDSRIWEVVGSLIADVEYYRGGKKIFTANTIVGSVFIITGIRHGGYAINIDTRKAKHFYDDLISVLVDDAIPTAWLVRKVLEE